MYHILSAKSDYVDGRKPKIIATISYEKAGEKRFLTNLEYNGRPNFYLTGEDIYDQCISLEEPDDALAKYQIKDFDGFALPEDYEGLLSAFDKTEEKDSTRQLLLYLVLITRSDSPCLEDLIEAGTEKDIEELDLAGIDLAGLF